MRNFFTGFFVVTLIFLPYLAPAATRPSITGTAIPSATQIVDGQLDTWTLSGGVAYENGATTPSSGVILLLYYGGIVYQENIHNNWWLWGGTGVWIATSDPRTVSASSTTIPSTTQIVDSQQNIWTLVAGVAYENGATTPSSEVTLLLYANSILYQENIHNDWWEWSSGAWVATSAPVVASAEGTTIPSATQIVDTGLNEWTLSGGQAYENGAVTPSSGVIQLLLYNENVYQENIHDNWWEWTSGAWVAKSSDPRVPALAAAVGYDTLTFNSTMLGTTSGTWQPSNLNGIGNPSCSTPAVQNSDGSFTVGNATVACDVVTAIKNSAGTGNWTGVTFKPGMYIKIVMSYTGKNPGATGSNTAWPAFWGQGIEHATAAESGGTVLDHWPGQAPLYEHFLEADFWEANCGYVSAGPCSNVNSTGTNTGLTTMNDWYGIYQQTCSPGAYCNKKENYPWDLATNATWAAQHTLEVVYVNATSSTNGYLATYIDGVKSSFPYTWQDYNAGLAPPPVLNSSAYSIGDVQNFALIAGTGINNYLTVYSIQVWQASSAGMTHQ